MQKQREAPTALNDFIRDISVPRGIHSDNAKVKTSKKWKDILRQYQIRESYTEPHHLQQNPAERRIGTISQGAHPSNPGPKWCPRLPMVSSDAIRRRPVEHHHPTESCVAHTDGGSLWGDTRHLGISAVHILPTSTLFGPIRIIPKEQGVTGAFCWRH